MLLKPASLPTVAARLKQLTCGAMLPAVFDNRVSLIRSVMLAVVTMLYPGFSATVAAAAQIEVDTTASGSFSLVDQRGNSVTEQDFQGKFMLVFFGYTFCPDVCPMDLRIMARAIDILGKPGDRVQPIFITLDPQRDTTEIVAAYASHFHPRMIGLSGSRQQTAGAAWNYGVVSVRLVNEADPENYSMNHSALTYLLGPDGRFAAAFDHGTDPEILAAGILQHLNKQVE